MKKDDHEDCSLERLEDFLMGDESSKDQTMRSLRKQGIDADAFVSRVNRVVQEGYSKQLKLAAEKEQAAPGCVPQFLSDLAGMSRAAMVAIFERVSGGEFGVQYQSAALARCRNKSAKEISEEELRSWLEDIGQILGEPDK